MTHPSHKCFNFLIQRTNRHCIVHRDLDSTTGAGTDTVRARIVVGTPLGSLHSLLGSGYGFALFDDGIST